MPTTQKFRSRGVGNGLPYCPPKVDVSSYDYWMTLGGTQKGNLPTGKQILLSLKNAIKLFWGLYGLNGNGEYNGTDGDWGHFIIGDINIDDANAEDYPAPDNEPYFDEYYKTVDDPSTIVRENIGEPFERRCYLNYSFEMHG